MLIVSRRLGEAITVGSDIRVAVLAINGSQVRLGIEAPRIVEVHRQEIYDEINGLSAAEGTSERKASG